MKKYKIAVLGAGNGGLTFAGDLALAGHSVNLFELPKFKSSLDPIEKAGGIEMFGFCRNGFAKLNLVTTDMKSALKGVEVIFVVTPAFAHIQFAEAMAPFLNEGQIVILHPGYGFGTIEFGNTLSKNGVDLRKISLGTISILIYATRKYLGNKVFCRATKAKIPFTAFPAKNTKKMIDILNQITPEEDGKRGILIPTDNELKTTLENINLYLHPPMMILKAVDVELGESPYTRAENSPAVKLLAKAMNQEGMSITKAFGLEPWTQDYLRLELMYPSWLKQATDTDRPDWANPDNMPAEYTPKANLLHMRYMVEDLPYGLVPIAELGKLVKLPMTAIDSVINIGSIITEIDFWKTGRTLAKLGLDGMSKDDLLRYVNEGVK